MNDFQTILVANRGEIALRVIETAKSQGYRTIAVYSEADAQAPHVAAADAAVYLGPAASAQSYLCTDKIIAACRKTGADALHPGYGFLAENADFAEACEQAGITFIGPPSQAIRLMGSKRASKLAMLQAEVPCIPGYQGSAQDDGSLEAEAKRIGFPLMIKASAGGGGRGMRLVQDDGDLKQQLRSARSEAKSAFGSDELILEKALLQPRHVEVQIFADQQGHCIYLGERDCSVQRRHQKVVEEAPCPVMDPELRQRMGQAAVEAALACNYVGAGTVEFLLDAERNFYFLEMNTRLQVEHPVTELVTGTDLVAWQIKVAAGEPLPLTQAQVSLTGHALEVRLYAEDPTQQFMPQTGPIHRWRPAIGEGIRIDAGISEGGEVSPHYDPMLAKIIAYGATRDEARRRLIRAVRETVLLGVNSNTWFLGNILQHQVFARGEATTDFIPTHFAHDASMSAVQINAEERALAGLVFYAHSAQNNTPSTALSNWRSNVNRPTPFRLAMGENEFSLQLGAVGSGVENNKYNITVGNVLKRDSKNTKSSDYDQDRPVLEISLHEFGPESLVYEYDTVRRRIHYALVDDELYLASERGNAHYRNITHTPPAKPDPAFSGKIHAPMDGAVVEIMVALGDRVQPKQTIGVLEAMKLEHQLTTEVSGTISAIHANPGDQVKNRQLIIEISPDDQ